MRRAAVRPLMRRIIAASLFWVALPWLGCLSAEDLQLTASPDPAAVYQKVTLSVLVPAGDPSAIGAEFHNPGGSIHVISGPYIQPYLDESNPTVPQVRVSYVIEGNEPGRVVIPPLSINVEGNRRKTQPFVMTFGVQRAGEIVVPLQPVWTFPNERPGSIFFVGEAIPVVLDLKNEPAPVVVDEVRLAGAPADLSEVAQFGHTTSRLVGATELYQVPAAAYMLTPTGAGTVTLPAARVSSGGRNGVSLPAELKVIMPPEAISESGAIGALSFRSWTTSRRVQGGEEIFLHLRVEGTGNLPNIALPRPTSSGLLELGTDETRTVVPGPDGYRGFRERVYEFLRPDAPSQAAAPAVVSVPSFVWLDPVTRNVESVPESTYTIALPQRAPQAQEGSRGSATSEEAAAGRQSGAPAASAGEQAATRVPFAPESAAAVRSSEYRELYSHGETYLWLLPGPLIFGIFLLVRPRRGGRSGGLGAAALFLLLFSCHPVPVRDVVSSGVAAYEKGDLAQAERDFASAHATYPRNSALSFDRALVQYRLGRYGAAIHLVRNAIYYDPLSAKYRAALDWMVNQIGVPEQVPPAYPIHPDLFLVVLIIALNAASILGILVMLKGRGGLAIALILTLVVVLICGGGLVYSAAKRSVQAAVVKSSGTEMTKIPMAVAGRWLELPAGMAVHILDTADGYYLVETAYGNTGWVRESRVLLDDR